MREALTVIGFLIIVAFSALLAAPLFVDWNGFRSNIAQQMANSLGATVLIEGPIDARILPQPWLSLTRVTIGEPNSQTTLVIDKVDAEVSLTALMKGEVVLTNVALDSPVLSVTADDKGAVTPLALVPPERPISLESFEITNGSIRYTDARSGAHAIDQIAMIGDARSLAGPFKGEGVAVVGGQRQSVNLSVGSVTGEGARVKLALVPTDQPLTYDLDGLVNIQADGPHFDGSIIVRRPPLGPDGDGELGAQREWRVTAEVAVTPAAAQADKVDIQIGPKESPVKLIGTGSLTLGEAPKLSAVLSASQIDFDRLAGLKPNERAPPLRVLDDLRLAAAEAGAPSIPLSIALKADGALLGGLALTGVSTQLSSSKAGWQVLNLTAGLPGRTRFQFTGDVGPEGTLDGQVEIEARQASALLSWLEGASRTASPTAAQRLTLTGTVKAGGGELSVSGLNVAVDDATAQGSVALKPASNGRKGRRIEADLQANRLDIDSFPSIAALLPGGGAVSEADVRFSARSVSFGGIEARSAQGHVAYEGDALKLSDVAIEDFGGASLTANGSIKNLATRPAGVITVGVDAKDLSPVAAALKRSAAPPALLAAFDRRAGALSPAKAAIELAFGEGRRLNVDGRFGGTQVAGNLDLTGEADDTRIEGSLKMASLDAVRLMQQLGLSPLPLTVAGEAHASFDIDGPVKSARSWSGRFDGAGITLEGSGKIVGSLEQPAMDGRARLGTPDLLSVAQLFGVPLAGTLPGEGLTLETGFRASNGKLALDDMTGVVLGSPYNGALTIEPSMPAAVSGRLALKSFDLDRLASLVSGSDLTASAAKKGWSESQFGALPGGVAVGKVALTIDRLGLGPTLPAATGVRAVVTLQPAATAIDSAAGTLAGGVVTGEAILSRRAEDIAVTGKLATQRVGVRNSVLDGLLDTSIEFQGSGRTPSSLIGALTGGGTASLVGGRIKGLSPDAFTKTVEAVDAAPSGAKLDLAAIMSSALAAGPLPIKDVGGSVALANGRLKLGTTEIDASGFSGRASGQIDLSSFSAGAEIALKPPAPGDGFGGLPPDFTMRLSTGSDGLSRALDADAIAAWATIRTAEREAKKLEQLEAERQAREAAAAEEKRKEAERMRQLIEAQRAEEARKAEELRKIEEAKRQKEEEALRKAEEARQLKEAQKAEEQRKAEEARQLKEAQKAEEQRKAEEARQLKEAQKAEERRKAEEALRLKDAPPLPPVPEAPSDVQPLPVPLDPLLLPDPLAPGNPTGPSVNPSAGPLPPSATGGAEIDPEPLPPVSTQSITPAPEPSEPMPATKISPDETFDPPPAPPLPPPIEIRRPPRIRAVTDQAP